MDANALFEALTTNLPENTVFNNGAEHMAPGCTRRKLFAFMAGEGTRIPTTVASDGELHSSTSFLVPPFYMSYRVDEVMTLGVSFVWNTTNPDRLGFCDVHFAATGAFNDDRCEPAKIAALITTLKDRLAPLRDVRCPTV